MKSFLVPFLLFLLVFSILLISPEQASAQTTSPSASPSAIASPTAKITYDLAYPGILPDNPLYKLKVARDKISAFLITDPIKKIDFYLLQADKGILAAAMLAEKKQYDLAKTTALKAENNMTLITFELKDLPKKPDPDKLKKLITASKKHQEVLSLMIKKSPKTDKNTFEKVKNFSITNTQTIQDYSNKPLIFPR